MQSLNKELDEIGRVIWILKKDYKNEWRTQYLGAEFEN